MNVLSGDRLQGLNEIARMADMRGQSKLCACWLAKSSSTRI
uniref:Uncharacterized protein n=1 Tax=Pseudomonas phage PACT201 TaxID=3230130 RepID=A0AAU8GSU1_9VIRU